MARRTLGPACYDWFLAASEARGLATRRHRLIASARGRVVDVDAGIGLNLRHYRPDRVGSVVAFQPEPATAARVALRAATVTVPFELRDGGVVDAGLGDATVDTVIATLALCRVADPEATAATIARILAPGGRLLLLEHVAWQGAGRWLQAAATSVWSGRAGGCHFDRDTLATVRAAGLSVSDCTRFSFPACGPLRPLLGSCVEAVAWRLPVGEPDPAMSVLAPRGADAV